MSEDPTRAMARQDAPVHGSVGPADPHADPRTDPDLRPVGRSESAPDGPTVPTTDGADASAPTVRTPVGHSPALGHTRTGGLWTGLILSAIVLIFLLIFIAQNSVPVRITFLGLSGTLPTGVALLFAAVAGLLLVAIPGGLRILQLRRVARRAGRA